MQLNWQRAAAQWLAPRCVAAAAAWALVAGGWATAAPAQAPHPVFLLPPDTLAYVSVADVPDLRDRLKQTAMGRMIQHPQMRPLVEELYGSVETSYGVVQQELGLSLDELASLVQGSLTVALVPHEQSLVPIVLVDVGDANPLVDKLLEGIGAAIVARGGTRREPAGGDEGLVIYDWPAGPAPQLGWFRREGLLVVSRPDALEDLLLRWRQGGAGTLADNAQFASISDRWRQQADVVQITAFVDPIGIFREQGRNSGGAQLVLALLPTLGLDGVKAVGGGMTVATEEFDTMFEGHVVLESPRAGVVALAAPTTGETTPEPWVPSDSATYTTLHWDVEGSYRRLSTLIDSFQGEGAFGEMVERRINEPLGIDLAADVVPALAGRFSWLSWIERPVTLGSQATMLGVQLTDAAAFRSTLEKVATRQADRLQARSFGSQTYWEFKEPIGREQEGIARPKPCFGIVGNWLLATDRASLYEKAIVTTSDASLSLGGALDYKLIASKISRLPGGARPSLASFNRPEEGIRYLYDLAGSEQTRSGLARAGERSQFLADVGRALENNPLPPFAVLEQFLAPGGALMTSDDTGIHYVSFSLSRGN